MVASPLPIPKSRGYYRERAAKLEEFRDRYPTEDQALLWAYLVMSDPNHDVVKFRESGVETRSIWPQIGIYELMQYYQRDHDLSKALESIVKSRANMNRPETYDTWNQRMGHTQSYRSGSSSSVRYAIEFGKYRHFYDTTWDNYKDKRALYETHKAVMARMEALRSMSLKIVFDGIEKMKKDHPPSGQKQGFELAASKAPLEIAIPEMDDETIKSKVEAIEPNSFDDITGFGLDLQRDFAAAIQQISEYFIQHSARPARTLDRVEAIMQTTENIHTANLLPAMPQSGFDRFRGRILGVRLAKPEDMPFAEIIEMTRDLPQRAEEDDGFYSHDLKIVDHAIKLCVSYADIIDRSRKAFEADRQRLVQIDENQTSLALGLASSSIPELYETRLTELAASNAFLNQQAARFGQIGRTIGHTRMQLGRMAAVSATVQTPALDAIQAFNLYQLKRLQAFGRNIDDKVLEQLDINNMALAELSLSSEDSVIENMDRARVSLNATFATLRSTFHGNMGSGKNMAREISEETTKHMLNQAGGKPLPS